MPKIRKKSAIHENADANITCNFSDGDISRLGVAYLTHTIHRYIDTYIITSIILKVKQFPLTNWPYSLDNILYLNHTLLLNAILTK